MGLIFLMPITHCVGIPPRNRSRLIRYYLIIDSMCRFVPRGSVRNQTHPGFFISCCILIVSFSPSYLTLYPFRIPPGTRGADTSCWRSSHGVRRPRVNGASHSLQHARRQEAQQKRVDKTPSEYLTLRQRPSRALSSHRNAKLASLSMLTKSGALSIRR